MLTSFGIDCWMLCLLDWGLHLPCCPPGSRDPSLKDTDGSLAHYAVSQTCRLRRWDLDLLSPIDCCVCVYVCVIVFRLWECEEDINVCWCSTSSEPAFDKSCVWLLSIPWCRAAQQAANQAIAWLTYRKGRITNLCLWQGKGTREIPRGETTEEPSD